MEVMALTGGNVAVDDGELFRAVDSAVNALPILCFERAREHARRLMQRPLGERGLLAGLPVPIKDLTDVAGVRTTYGSPIFADFVPEASDILVKTIEAKAD